TAVRDATGKDLGTPANRTPFADPCCVLLFDKTGAADHLQVFAPFETDGQLHTRLLDLNLNPTGSWTGLANPQSISGWPYAIGIVQTQHRLFAASGQSAMLQLAARPETGFVTEVDSSRMLFLGPQVPLVNPSGKPRSARIPSTPASAPPEPLVEPFDGPSLARFVGSTPRSRRALLTSSLSFWRPSR